MCLERRRFSQTMASEWQTAFVVSHKMPWCALLTAVKNYNKSLEKLQDFFFKTRDPDQDQMFKTKTKTSWSKTKTKTFIFVLEAPRDQDPALEDYITANNLQRILLTADSTSISHGYATATAQMPHRIMTTDVISVSRAFGSNNLLAIKFYGRLNRTTWIMR